MGACLSDAALTLSQGLVRWARHLGKKGLEVTPDCPWPWPSHGDHQSLQLLCWLFLRRSSCG